MPLPDPRLEYLNQWRASVNQRLSAKQALYNADPTVRLGLAISTLQRLERELTDVELALRHSAPDFDARFSALRIAVGCHQLLHEDTAANDSGDRQRLAPSSVPMR